MPEPKPLGEDDMTKSLRITGKNSDGDYWLHIHGATQSAGLNLGDPAGLIASALVMAASGQTFIRADAPELVALVEALRVARRTIVEGGGGGVTCTVLVPDDVCHDETLVDHIDAAIAAYEAIANKR